MKYVSTLSPTTIAPPRGAGTGTILLLPASRLDWCQGPSSSSWRGGESGGGSTHGCVGLKECGWVEGEVGFWFGGEQEKLCCKARKAFPAHVPRGGSGVQRSVSVGVGGVVGAGAEGAREEWGAERSRHEICARQSRPHTQRQRLHSSYTATPTRDTGREGGGAEQDRAGRVCCLSSAADWLTADGDQRTPCSASLSSSPHAPRPGRG